MTQPAPQQTRGRAEPVEISDQRRLETAHADANNPGSSRPRPKSGSKLWRILSIIGCLAGIVVVAIWLRQGLEATPDGDDSAAPQQNVTAVEGTDSETDAPAAETAEDSIPIPLNTAQETPDGQVDPAVEPSDPFNGTITVSEFAISDTMQVGVLGSDIRTPIGPDAATVEVATPAGITTIIGLWEGETIRGMTIVNQPENSAGPDQNTISPATTAQSLVALFPGVLRNDVRSSLNRSATVVGTDAFVQLSDAIRDRSGVMIDTPDIAIALSGAVNELGPLENLDPSCGTNAPNTVASGGGVCFNDESPPIVTNETTRWTIMLDASSQTLICGAVGPKGQARIALGESCGPSQLVIGPGPLADGSTLGDDERRAIRGASGLHAFADYGLVLNDLIFGTNSRSTDVDDATIVASTPQLVEQAVSLTDNDAELAEAGLALGAVDAHADVRVLATIDLTRAMMLSGAPAAVNKEPWSESSFAVGLTDLFRESAQWVSKSAPIPSWSMPAASVVDVTGATTPGESSGGAGSSQPDTTGGSDADANGAGESTEATTGDDE